MWFSERCRLIIQQVVAALEQSGERSSVGRRASRRRGRCVDRSAVAAMVERLEQRVALTSFQAIGLQDQFNDLGTGSIPPDTMGAVGPNHFVEVINSSVAIYQKTGTRLSHVSLTSFFTDASEGITPANGTFDPRVLFDQATGRWFATALERGVTSGKDNDIILAVSDTSDPTGDWDRYRIDVGIPTGANAFFTDYSTLGVDENGVYFGMTMFQDTGNDGSTNASFAKIAVTPKASLIAPVPSLSTVTQFSNITDMYSAPQPATNFDDIAATDPFYFVSSSTTVFGNVNYRKVTWSGVTPSLSSTSVVTTPAYANPINAPASGSTTNINVGDDRLQMAMVRDGHLWTTRQVGLNSSGTESSPSRTGVEWIDLNVTGVNPVLTQSGRIFDNAASDPRFYYYPSLAVNGQGHMRIGFSGSKSTEFVSAYSSGRLASDSAGATTTPVLIKAGEASYTRLDGSGRNRWGDYSFTSVDPNDDMTVWTVQEYAESNGTNVWGTWVSSIAAPTPTLNNPAATANKGTNNVTLNLTGTHFFDPGAGFPNHLGVQLTGGATNGITIDSVTFNSATSVTVVFDVDSFASSGARNIVLTNPDGQSVTVVGGLSITGNSPPVALDTNVNTNEDTAKTFSVADFPFMDAEGDSLTSISIDFVNLASGDTLQVNLGAGLVDVTAGMTITAAQIPTMVYTPADDANGVNRSSFQFFVNDSFGSGTVSAPILISVDPVNDDPVNTVASVTTNEETPVAVTGMSIADIDSTGPFSVNLRLDTPGAGTLTLRTDVVGGLTAGNITNNGTANLTITGATLAAINTTLGNATGLTYTPATNFSGSVAFAMDTTNDGDGGSDTGDSATWTVTGVNDVPVALISNVTTNEDTAKVFAVSNFLFSDVETDGLVSITVSNLALAGVDTLRVDRGEGLVAVANGMTLTAAQIATMVYTPSVNANGAARSSFSFKVNDADPGTVSATMTINVTSVNDAPVLAGIEVPGLGYSENQAAVSITSSITITDVDHVNLSGATVTIFGNYANGQDVLSFTNANGITGVFNAGTGVMTLSGSATKANYQAALRSVKYQNTSDQPSTLLRTIRFQVTDGTTSSNIVSRTLGVASVNDLPVLGSPALTPLSFSEGSVPLAIQPTITISDADHANMSSARIRITDNYQNGSDVLSFTPVGAITGVFTPATGTLVLSGSDTKANYQTALRSVKFQNTSNNPSAASRNVLTLVNDGSSNSSVAFRAVNVTPVNDAAVLAGIEASPLAYTEGNPATSITSSLTVSDVDNTTLSFARVKIGVNYVNGQDILSFANTPTISAAFDAATGTLVLTGTDTVSNYRTALRNVKYRNTSTTPSTLTRTVLFLVNDGNINSNVVSRNITVTAVP